MAPTVRDVQTISLPATILQLLIFFLANFAVGQTGSWIEIAAAIFPLSSPYMSRTSFVMTMCSGAIRFHSSARSFCASRSLFSFRSASCSRQEVGRVVAVRHRPRATVGPG